MTKCSVVMMAWTRPENVNRIIEKYNCYGVIDEIIVWNNNKKAFVSDLGLGKVKVLNCSSDFGLDSRFVAATLAKNRCVVVHDDDLELSEKNIQNLVTNFESDHTRIYTYEGRVLKDGAYTCDLSWRVCDVLQPTEATIALTRSTCFDRMYAAEYCKFCDVIFYDVPKNLNGEDIVFSYMVSHLSGKMPLVLPLPDRDGYVELPTSMEEKISTRPNHIERRTELISRCEIILPLPKYPPTDEKKIVFFGSGNYPFAYHQESFNLNSVFKKLLVKETRGIKYLSFLTSGKFPYCMSTIRCNVSLGKEDLVFLGIFYIGTPNSTMVSFLINMNGSDLRSKPEKLKVKENCVTNFSLRIGDFFEESDPEGFKNCTLKAINFLSINDQGEVDREMCISEISLVKVGES